MKTRLSAQALRIIGLVTHLTGVTYLALLARRHLLRRYGVYILSYHHVRPDRPSAGPHRDVAARRFEAHLRFLTGWFDIVSLQEAAKLLSRGKLERDVLVITFDDGYADNHSQAFPALLRVRVPATIFLITGLVGTDTAPWYDEALWLLRLLAAQGRLSSDADARWAGPELAAVQGVAAAKGNPVAGADAALEVLKRSPREFRERAIGQLRARCGNSTNRCGARLMSWHQAREMTAHGVTFGSHTVRHPVLTTLESSELESELAASRDAIVNELGTSCDAFAFPNGDFDERTVDAVRRAGYGIACTQTFGPNRPGSDLLMLRRIGVGDVPHYVLALKLSGLVTPFFEARRWWHQSRRKQASRTAPSTARKPGGTDARTERVVKPQLGRLGSP